ncbi:MAG: nuclear transport factor 2 family protein [Cytophagales bacterium]|nr:nuclear transport factor 2 family protein [Cytophagales bacterium]
MKGGLITPLLFLVCLLTQAQDTAERDVLSLSMAKFGWLINKQADSLQKYLDDRIQYIHSNGWIQTKAEILEDMLSGKLVYQKVEVKEASVRIYGQTALVTGLGRFEGINSGTPFSIDLRYTEVFVRTVDRWKLASRHSNRMP